MLYHTCPKALIKLSELYKRSVGLMLLDRCGVHLCFLLTSSIKFL